MYTYIHINKTSRYALRESRLSSCARKRKFKNIFQKTSLKTCSEKSHAASLNWNSFLFHSKAGECTRIPFLNNGRVRPQKIHYSRKASVVKRNQKQPWHKESVVSGKEKKGGRNTVSGGVTSPKRQDGTLSTHPNLRQARKHIFLCFHKFRLFCFTRFSLNKTGKRSTVKTCVPCTSAFLTDSL